MNQDRLLCWMMIMPGVLGGCGTMEPEPQNVEPRAAHDFRLWSDGTTLRGANVYQRRVYPALDGSEFLGPGPIGPPYTPGDLNRLADEGANLVIISHPGLHTEGPPYGLDAAVQANLDRLLDWAADAGLFAVISFRTGPGRSEFAIFEGQTWFPPELVDNRVWQDQAAQDAWADMWRATAERYRDHPAVAGYDLMVEPNGPSTQLGIHDPEAFHAEYTGTLVDWNQMHPRIVRAIRTVDPDTPILISPAGYGNLAWLPYLDAGGDPRTVASVHHYEPSAYSHQAAEAGVAYPGMMTWDGVTQRVDQAWLAEQMVAIDAFRSAHGMPVAITEFGVVRWAPGAARYVDDLSALFEARGLNYAVWLWEPIWPPGAEDDDFDFLHGPDPDAHERVARAPLVDVIRAAWQVNRARPTVP